MNNIEAHKATALILETNNLRGAAEEDRVVKSLERLLRHLSAQTFPVRDLTEVVLTHDGLTEQHQAGLEAALGRPIRFVAIAPDTGYYEAKNQGFDATTADVVVFADADCWPDQAWLARLCAPLFEDAQTQVVAGRTTYRDDLLGIAATSIDFMYFPSPLGEGSTRNFYANNVAFRREIFAARRYEPAEGIYRGHCQKLGMRLAADGVRVRFEPSAHTTHRFPDSAAELFRLRLLRGADTVELSPYLGRAYLPPQWRWLSRLGPLTSLGVLAARFGFSARAVGKQGLSEVRGARRAACLAVVGGLSAADAAGALARSVVGARFGVRDGGLREGALSYHGDGDRLRSAAEAA
jgi:glycosyltransferase involved in cell wall biosynthesis